MVVSLVVGDWSNDGHNVYQANYARQAIDALHDAQWEHDQ